MLNPSSRNPLSDAAIEAISRMASGLKANYNGSLQILEVVVNAHYFDLLKDEVAEAEKNRFLTDEERQSLEDVKELTVTTQHGDVKIKRSEKQ